MTYDYAGFWARKTGYSAPLFTSDGNNVNDGVQYSIQGGAPAEKVIMGVPTYGVSFTLADPSNNGIGAPISGPGKPGQYTAGAGALAYYEICANTKQNGWTVVPDPSNEHGPYAYSGDQWVSYDDVSTVRRKAEQIQKLNLGGTEINPNMESRF